MTSSEYLWTALRSGRRGIADEDDPRGSSGAKPPRLLADDNGDAVALDMGDTLCKGGTGVSAGGLNSGGGIGGVSVDSDLTREGRSAKMELVILI